MGRFLLWLFVMWTPCVTETDCVSTGTGPGRKTTTVGPDGRKIITDEPLPTVPTDGPLPKKSAGASGFSAKESDPLPKENGGTKETRPEKAEGPLVSSSLVLSLLVLLIAIVIDRVCR